jgi:hypothetical protein
MRNNLPRLFRVPSVLQYCICVLAKLRHQNLPRGPDGGSAGARARNEEPVVGQAFVYDRTVTQEAVDE